MRSLSSAALTAPRTALAIALHAVLLGSVGLTATLPSNAAFAATASSTRSYDLPAAPLEDALNRFAQEAGITLPFDPALVQNKQAPALQGDYAVADALSALLAGSGLAALQGDGGTWSLYAPSAQSGALELSGLSISGKAPGSTTEGSGSYTTYSSSSSTRLNLSPKETPQTVAVVTQQRLQDQRLTTIIDTLEAVPGITVIREGLGADADSFWSRGFAISNYEIDGVPTSSKLDNYSQSTAMYDRVEIVRGATGLISGMGNPSATINLIRKRPTYDPQVSLTAEAGSWDRYGTGIDVSGPLTDSGNVRARLVVDYKDQKAWADRYQQQSSLVYGISEFDLSETTLLTLGFSYQNSEADAPLRSGFPLFYSNGAKTDFKRSFNTSPGWTYYDREQTSFFASVEHQFNNGWSGKVEVSHARNDYDAVVSYLASDTGIDQATGSGAYIMPTRFTGTPEQNGVDAYVTGPFTLFGREHELILGLTASRVEENGSPDWGGWKRPGGSYDGSIPDLNHWNGAVGKPQWTQVGESDLEENQKALYLTSRFHLTDAATLILGSRVIDWDRTGTYTPNSGASTKTEQTESGVTIPYAGLVYDLNETWALYASYTKIFNPQGSWVRDINNATLAPEEGTSYETGVKAEFYEGRLNASFALYKAEQDNLALWDNNTSSYYVEEGVSSKGAEFEVNGELTPGWQFAGGYSYNVSEDTDGSRIITQTPRHSAKVFTTYRLQGALDKLTVGGGVNWQSKTSYDLHTYTQEPYTLVNLMARYDISENLSASVNLNNLFDKEYFTSASSYGSYGAPRNLMTGLKYTF